MKTGEVGFVLRGEHIALDALLKATGLVQSGGEAKTLVVSGAVEVDGRIELRRGCKLRPGQLVSVGHARVRVLAEGSAT